MDVKELVIVGEEEIGKTTLANALLGWDIFPQTNDGWYARTEENASQMLTDSIRLTDTPGYDLLWYNVPESVNEGEGYSLRICYGYAAPKIYPGSAHCWYHRRCGKSCLLQQGHEVCPAEISEAIFAETK